MELGRERSLPRQAGGVAGPPGYTTVLTSGGPHPPITGDPLVSGVDLNNLTWRTASASGASACVEVAFTPDGTVVVRDTKNRQGPVLTFTGAEWRAFLTGARSGEFNTP